MANKRKTTTVIVAGVTAAALVLGGTFAWTSISQQARNEAIVDINPGGRLHDDFNGTNKDVYVENFGDELTGVNIYARIKLTEYMEVGPDAGKDKNGTDRNVKVIYPEGAEQPVINDPGTWITYIPAETDPAHTKDVNDTVYTNYWDWELGKTGDLPYYMPTFNMNKDSLLADINGTYEGTVEGDIVHYDNYVEYKDGDSKTGTEVYDWDSDTKDEDGDVLAGQYDNGGVTTDDTTPIDNADVYHKENQNHPAKQISTESTVITMQEWLKRLDDEDPDNDTGAFWVYDTDGWAYWAQPIAPGKTSGLLLDSIEQIRVPDDNWYYGIDVVGQFVTASDLSAFENENDGFSDNAKELMGKVAEVDNELELTGPTTIASGSSATYSATFKSAGVALKEQPAVNWTITDVTAPANAVALFSDDTGINVNDGTVTVAENVAVGTTFKVNVSAGTLSKSMSVTVEDAYEVLTLNQSLTSPLRVGETKSYKLVFVVDTEESEGGVDGSEIKPSDFYVNYASCSEYANYEPELVEGKDYTYDRENQILTVTQPEKGSYFSFEARSGGSAYEVTLLPPVQAYAVFHSTTEKYNESLNIVVTAEENIPENAYLDINFIDQSQTDGVSLNGSLDELPTVEVQNVKLYGEYGDTVLWDEEEQLLYMTDTTDFVALKFDYNDKQHNVVVMANLNARYTDIKLGDFTKDEGTGIYSGDVLAGTVVRIFSDISNGDIFVLELADGQELLDDMSLAYFIHTGENLHAKVLNTPGYVEGEEMKISLKAYSHKNPQTTYDIVLNVKNEWEWSSDITIKNNKDIKENNTYTISGTDAETINFTAEYSGVLGANYTETWSVSGPEGVTIDPSSGVLNIPNDVECGLITVNLDVKCEIPNSQFEESKPVSFDFTISRSES